MTTCDMKDNEDEELKFGIETIEKMLLIRDYICKKEGRKFSFVETLDYVIQELVNRENILDELHEMIKKDGNAY